MGTTVKSNKVFNAALFTEATRANTFTNLLTDGAPQAIDGKKARQTSPQAPIVRVTDLTKGAGDEVEVDVFHQLNGLPTMGDRKLEGRGEALTSASMDLKINQGRHMVDAGGKMAQQRTKHNLQAAARGLLSSDNYLGRLNDQKTLIHLAGARGSLLRSDDIVPLQSHNEFGDIMVNEVKAPTFDRHFYGGDATSLANLDSGDKFSLDVIERMSLTINESNAMPIQPIRYKADSAAYAEPLYVAYVSPRMMYDFKQTNTAKDLNMLIANAVNRSKGFNHPLFQGECYLWEGILIRTSRRYIEFAQGFGVDVAGNNNDGSTSVVNAAVKAHRGILLGAQALAHAFGNVGKHDGSDAGYIGMTEVDVDHDNGKEISMRWMDGMSKIRFADKNGRINDHGVAVFDCSVSS